MSTNPSSTFPVPAFPVPALPLPTLPEHAIPPGSSKLLSSVLSRLGHECAGPCPAADHPDVGDVRFAWRNPRRESSFLVVDLDPHVAPIPAQRLLQRINQCTGQDRIRVLARQPTDRSHALAAFSPPWTVLS